MNEPVGEMKKGATSKAGYAAGWVAGTAVGIYSGFNLLLPLFATGGVWWAGSRLLKDEKKIIIPALSVNAGHFVWLSLGVVLTGALNADVADLVIYAIGLLWLIKKPGAGPLYLLCAYQVLSLVFNTAAFLDASVGSISHKALLVHLIWRTLALILMVKLFFSLRQNAPPANAT